MERFRRWPCQPALQPASQLAKTEGENLPTAVSARSTAKEKLVWGALWWWDLSCAGRLRNRVKHVWKSKRHWEKGREKKGRELVEARCTPQSRPDCLVARSNQTWCHRQLNLDLKGGLSGEGGVTFSLPRITLGKSKRRRRKGKSVKGSWSQEEDLQTPPKNMHRKKLGRGGGWVGVKISSKFARMGNGREFAGRVIRFSPRAEACGMSEAARTAQPVPEPPLCPLITLRNWIPGVAALNSFIV